jgi:hypothetical protein
VIKIYTGSHYLNKERNRQAFKELNSLLLSSENPYQGLFQTENLILDDTDGFVSIQPTCRDIFYSKDTFATIDMCVGLTDFIKNNVECDGVLSVYIGEYIY